MLRPFLLAALFVCFTSLLHAQNTDTTLQRIFSLKDDSSKVKDLYQYTRKIRNTDIKKANELYNLGIKIGYKVGYLKGVGDGLFNLSFIEGTSGKYESAIQFCLKARRIYEQIHDTLAIARTHVNIATCYTQMGKADSAVIHYMTALPIFEKRQNFALMSSIYTNLGAVYSNNLKNEERSVYYYKKSEGAARKAKDTLMLIGALHALTAKSINDKDGKSGMITSSEALKLAKAINDNSFLGYAYDSYALVLRLRGDLPGSVEASKQAIKYAQTAQDVQGFLFASITLAKTLEDKKDYKTELGVLNQALQKAKEINNVSFMRDIYERLAKANYAVGNYKTGYDYLILTFDYRDSIIKAENSKLIADLEIKYQASQKEKAISQQQLKISQQHLQLQKSRYYIYATIAGLVIALLLAGLLYLRIKAKKLAYDRQLKNMEQEREIQLLQALMQGEEKERSRIAKDLHDGVAGMLAAVKMHFSTLATQVEGVADKKGYQKGISLLDETSYEVRKTAHNLMPEVLIQYGLDESLRRYCNNISNSALLSVQYDSWGAIERFKESFELSVYRIVQELLNNIIKHSKATTAIVQLSHHNHILAITVEDNGVGFQSKLQKDGVGLQSILSRVKAMNGTLQIEGEPGSGVSAYLEFDTATVQRAKMEMA